MPRHRLWGDRNISVTLVPTVSQQLVLLANLSGGDTKTLVRLIGRLVAQPNDLVAQVDGSMVVDIGIGVVTDQAFAVAGASMPDPTLAAQQPARGWLYKQQMVVTKEHATGTTNEFTHIDTLQFDLKAARKVDRGTLFVRFEANNLTGASPFDVRLAGVIRALCLA